MKGSVDALSADSVDQNRNDAGVHSKNRKTVAGTIDCIDDHVLLRIGS